MKPLDRLLQRWRIVIAAPWIRSGARVLDVGSADGALFDHMRRRGSTGVGIDPNSPLVPRADGVRPIRGLFPADAPDGPFDAITMLAVEEYHGFSTAQTRTMFEPVGFALLRHRRFQLGLNTLFVFERRATE